MARFKSRLPILMLLFIATLPALNLSAQSGIKGKVVAENGQALEGATIELLETDKNAITDKRGRFEIEFVKPDSYVIQARYLGRISVSQTVKVEAEKMTSIRVVMELDPVETREVRIEGEARSGMKNRGLFDDSPWPEEEGAIDGFFATRIFKDHLSKEVWVSEEQDCINMEASRDFTFEGEGAIHVSWDKSSGECPWLGMGFGWEKWAGKDLGRIYKKSAITFRVATKGRPMKGLPVAIALEDYGDVQAWVGFSRKMMDREVIDDQWTQVIIPITAFEWPSNADVTNIKQLMIQFEASGDIYLDDIRVIEHIGSLKARIEVPYFSEEPGQNSTWSQTIIEGDTVQMSLSQDALHIRVAVQDTSPLKNAKEGKDIWNGDAFELAISAMPNTGKKRKFLLSTDHHIGIQAIPEKPVVWHWKRSQALQNVDVQTQLQEWGYIMDVRIPLVELSVSGFELDKVYSLELAIDKGDNSGRQTQHRWNAPDRDGFHKDPSLWGEVIFRAYP